MKSKKGNIFLGTAFLSAILFFSLFPETAGLSKIHISKSLMDLTQREYLSFIINGIQTVAVVAILISAIRLIAAIAIGILSGLGSLTLSGLISLFVSLFRIIPANIAGLVILSGAYANESLRGQFPMIMIAVLSITGWSEPAGCISREMKELGGGSLSKGGEAAGRGPVSIALANIGRILRDRIPSMFFEQTAKVLTVIAQLCIFYGLFEGFGLVNDSLFLIESQDHVGIARFIPDWHTKPWLALYPALAFFIGIFASMLLAEGLKKRPVCIDSDKKGRSLLPAKGILLFAASVMAILFINKNIIASDFSIAEIRRSLVFERTDEMIPGSLQAGESAELIAAELEKMGYLPISGSYFQGYERGAVIEPIYDELVFETENSKIAYEAGKDYFADSYGRFDVSGAVHDGRRMDYYSMQDKYGEFSDKWILIEKREYSQEDIMSFARRILKESQAKGVLVCGNGNENRHASQGRILSERPVVTVSEKMSACLAEEHGKLTYRQIAKTNDNKGINVLAEMGDPEQKKQKTIVIGMSYGWQYEPLKSGKIDFGLELAKQLAARQDDLGANVTLAFFDTAGGEGGEGMDHFAKNLPLEEEKICLYMDLTKVYEDVSGHIAYGIETSGEDQAYAVFAGKTLRSVLSRNHYPFEYSGIKEAQDSRLAKEDGINTLSISFDAFPESSMDIEDFGDAIVETILMLGR